MTKTNSFPSGLASHLKQYLPKGCKRSVTVRVLTEFLECAYFASMKTEESLGIKCTLAFVNYLKPDSDPPPLIRPHRPRFVKFEKELPYNVKTLVNLAQAADPATTEIAVALHPSGILLIVGLVDQEVPFRRSLGHEEGAGFGRLGIFQVEVTGIGVLTVYRDRTLLGGLRQNVLASDFLDALRQGPIAKILAPFIVKSLAIVRKEVGAAFDRSVWWSFDDWELLVRETWLGALSRILLSIQRYGHGGALLLLPKKSHVDLNTKYPLHYDVLESAIVQRVVNHIRESQTWWTVHDDYCESDKDLIPIDLYFSATISVNEMGDANQAIDGAVAFIASLSRVDGLITAADGLRIEGFGVEITKKEDPKSIYAAGNEKASVGKLRKQDAQHWGTRHRSMMRYCFAHPGSLGFVISQDGDIRGIARVGKRLVIWEQIRLQKLELPKSNVTSQGKRIKKRR